MAQLVVAYPKLSQEDVDWIAKFRQEHDKEFVSVVDPHYTLVFPTEKALTRDQLKEHIEKQAIEQFDTRCRTAKAVANPFIGKWHVFLVPAEGYEKIVELHDRLYTGPLKDQLHPTEPFIPHIGIATLERREECEELAAILNQTGLDVRAPVTEMDLCDYDGQRVTTSLKVPLR